MLGRWIVLLVAIVASVTLDGTVLDKMLVPLTDDGLEHHVDVVLG